MTQEVHKSDVGTRFEITVTESDVILDISLGTSLLIVFKKPGGEEVSNTATFTTDGSDGKIDYTTLLTSELDEAGVWYMQGRVTISGKTWSTEKSTFVVLEAFDI